MIKILIYSIILSSLIVILSKKIEISVFFLIFTFAFSALFFIYVGLPILGFIYLIVYTAAISILFIFVIMMLDIPISKNISFSLPLIGGILLLYPLWNIMTSYDLILNYHNEWNLLNLDQMQSLAYVLYSEHISLLLILSILLLIIMVALIHFLYI